MNKESEVKVEQLGIYPLILTILREIGLIETVDEVYERHGNWVGASKGVILSVWLCYIISECDHRLSSLEDWVSARELSLKRYLSEWGYSISARDCTDDKLILLLEDFSNQESWSELEQKINRNFISVYDLEGKIIQLDPTVGKSFKSSIEKGGLFQYGNSKHFRSDLPQFKTILANLSTSNFPLGSITVSGEQADDVLYIPMIKEAKKSFDKNGLMWKGDSKLSSLKNRKYISRIGDYYLSPLSKVSMPKLKLYEKYLKAVKEGSVLLESISRTGEVIAEGYERSETLSHEGFQWKERQLVVRSHSYAKSQAKSLDVRLLKAGKALLEMNKRKQGKPLFKTQEELKKAGDKILNLKKVRGLLDVEYRISYEKKTIRGYKDKPAREEEIMNYTVLVKKDDAAIAKQKYQYGWRVYVTNQSKEKLSLEQAVLLYREEYKIERRIRNMKEEVAALLPVFLKKDNRIVALINVLLVVLKVISLMEYKVAKSLSEKGEELGEIYPGNPKITTPRPTISKMKDAFENTAIVYILEKDKIEHAVLQKLTNVQKKIMDLMGIPPDLFEKLKCGMPILNSE